MASHNFLFTATSPDKNVPKFLVKFVNKFLNNNVPTFQDSNADRFRDRWLDKNVQMFLVNSAGNFE